MINETPISRCKKCQSTDRVPYYGIRRMISSGQHDGKPYTAIVWKRTRCRQCQQVRIDKVFECRIRNTDKPNTGKTRRGKRNRKNSPDQ